MHRRSARPIFFVLLILLPLALTTALPGPEAAPRTVAVTGVGTASVLPDIATVRIGVESTAREVGDALTASRDLIDAITNALVDIGISPEDIETANYGFSFERPVFSDIGSSRGGSVGRTTYRVNNVLTVTIRDLGTTGDIIDAAVLSGANQMWGVEFGVLDPAPARATATQHAVEAAADRAAYLAELAGFSVGPLLSLEESEPRTPLPSTSGADRIVFEVQVTATYELVPRNQELP